MSERSKALAQQVEQVTSALAGLIEGCSDQQWQARCAGETWSVGVTAHHVAGVHIAAARFVEMLAKGQPLPPLSQEMIDQLNAEHAREHASCTRADTLAMLRANSASTTTMLRGLSDEQLDRSAPMPLLGGASVSAEQFASGLLVQSVQEHVDSIRAAL
jgi:hypothetical protein